MPYSLIKEFLDVDASPYEFQHYLSLSGPTIERVIETEDKDFVFDIEVTSNRVDAASVCGIVQEASAILPNFGKSARIKENILTKYKFKNETFPEKKMLQVELDTKLCPRFTAVVMDNVVVGKSAKFLTSVLQKIGIRSINNVVDISNFLMILFGQPVHIFDYDKVRGGFMKLRASRKGEEIFLLDEKKYVLPGGDIIIEDGDKRLIDLCGIMGGKLSEVDVNTRRIILFVQTYDKTSVRNTCLKTGIRTLASSYFEKGLDSERVEPTVVYGIKLLQKYARAKVASQLVDISNNIYRERQINVPENYFSRMLGITVTNSQAAKILESLGFKTKLKSSELKVTVPFWRQYDIYTPADLFEEVARIYGYHNIPEELSPFKFISDSNIREFEKAQEVENRIKIFLANSGFSELYNYSMLSKEDLKTFALATNSLEIANPITSDLVYFRQTLLPSLIKAAVKNKQLDELNIFEAGHIYLPEKENLPKELKKIALLSTKSFLQLKGIVENILALLNIENFSFVAKNPKSIYLNNNNTAALLLGGKNAGIISLLDNNFAYKLGLQKSYSLAELDLSILRQSYNPVTSFSRTLSGTYLIEDITYIASSKTNWQVINDAIFSKFPDVKRIVFVGSYKDAITMRLFSQPVANKSILKDIVLYLEKALGVKVKKL